MDRRTNELARKGQEVARIFKGFPVPFTADRIADLQEVVNLAREGDIELVQVSIRLYYWHECEEGWELRVAESHHRPVGSILR